MPFRHLKVIKRILKIIRCSKGSHCSFCNTCNMCSCLGVSAIILAAAFWTCWSRLIVFCGSPYKSELQKSSLEVMKACKNISTVWRLIYFLILLIFRRWKKPALHTAVTWCSIDMTVSYRTLIFLAVDGGGGRWLAFKTTGSVLSLFILRMFTIIQASISRTQSSIANLARSAVDDMKVRYNCVSSAYNWKLVLWCLLISLKGHI